MRATAKITVELEMPIPVGNSWGDDCALGQLRQQAKESALTKIDELLRRQARIIRTNVTAILVDERG